jgi:hypothetical protein
MLPEMKRRPVAIAIVLGPLLGLACVAGRSSTGLISDPMLGSCSGNVAVTIPTSDCSATCSGDVAYALCDGTKYAMCGCSVPPGFTVGSDGGLNDGEPISDGSVSPLDGQALGIGPCSGMVALAISSAECPSLCAGSIAYALCEGTSYSECACTVPKGYTLAVLESGLHEAGSESGADVDDEPDGPPSDAHNGD